MVSRHVGTFSATYGVIWLASETTSLASVVNIETGGSEVVSQSLRSLPGDEPR